MTDTTPEHEAADPRMERNNLALMILVNLAKRVRQAKREKRRLLRDQGNAPRYYEAAAVETALHNAFEIARRIYWGHDDHREEFPLLVPQPKIRMRR